MMVTFSHIPRVCKNHARSSRAGGSAGIAHPGAGRALSCTATRWRGHFANILATTRAKLEWFHDAYQNPKQRIEPTISLLASLRRAARSRGGRLALWVPRALSHRYLQTSAPMGLGSGLLHRLGLRARARRGWQQHGEPDGCMCHISVPQARCGC